jgi:hypothetical protein
MNKQYLTLYDKRFLRSDRKEVKPIYCKLVLAVKLKALGLTIITRYIQ